MIIDARFNGPPAFGQRRLHGRPPRPPSCRSGASTGPAGRRLTSAGRGAVVTLRRPPPLARRSP